MLSYVCDAVQRQFPAHAISGIRRLKFLQPLLPEQPFRIELLDNPRAAATPVQVKFQCWSNATLLAEGQLGIAPQAVGRPQLQGE